MKNASAKRKRKPKQTMAGMKRQLTELESQVQLLTASEQQSRVEKREAEDDARKLIRHVDLLKTCCRHYKGQRDELHGIATAQHAAEQARQPSVRLQSERLVSHDSNGMQFHPPQFEKCEDLAREAIPPLPDLMSEPTYGVERETDQYASRTHKEIVQTPISWERL